jgi:hypothetical protein
MSVKNEGPQNGVAQPTKYAWVAAATLIAALLLGTFVAVPGVAAQGSAPLPYTDVSKFYVERMRAQAGSSAYAEGFPEPSYPEAVTDDVKSTRGQAGQEGALAPKLLPYTDVSKFHVERLRAQINQAAAEQSLASELAANPELLLARRAYVAQSELAANPELILVRRAYVAPGAQGGIAANPELILARRYYGQYDQNFLLCSLGSC